jgi:hypothetical protein
MQGKGVVKCTYARELCTVGTGFGYLGRVNTKENFVIL